MFRGLIAFVLALTIAFTGIAKPAYAYSNEPAQQAANSFVQSVIMGLVTTAGAAIGSAAACYAIDGIAATVFPPAIALAAFCPAAGAVSGGTTATVEGVQIFAGAH